MYDALEAILLKYLPHELIQKETTSPAPAEDGSKPTIIAISDSPEQLRKIKSLLGDSYKGVFVRDPKQAEQYLKKQTDKL